MIRGEITGLRAVEIEDLKLMRDWRNIPSFRQNFREFKELNMKNQNDWFDYVSSSKNDFMFIITRLYDNKPVGVCGLTYINQIIKSADFSFYIGHKELYIDDKGLAFDSANLLINYGFKTLNLNKIWMELYEFDDKKINFFTNKFNFKIDGKLRQNCFHDGKYYDSLMLSLIKSEYDFK